MDFYNLLIYWYLKNKRDLPWRNTTNSYQVWLSEIILQQTRVAQGLPYYLRFTERFPTVFDLANATEQEVLVLWQGLGYYSRARNLHYTARFIAHERNGVFPASFAELKKLKGIGDYTAAAIASFCYQEPVMVVDGNVFRVLSRFLGLKDDISNPSAKKTFAIAARELLGDGKSHLFNQAIMEFGALRCVPQNPDCVNCVFNKQCFAYAHKLVSSLPIKTKKTKQTTRFFNYLVVLDDHKKVLIKQRTGKDIWQNLYDFPLIEADREEEFDYLTQQIGKASLFSNEIIAITPFSHHFVQHKLSHQNLKIKFWKIQVNGSLKNGIALQKLTELPFPIVIQNFIEQHFLNVKKKQ